MGEEMKYVLLLIIIISIIVVPTYALEKTYKPAFNISANTACAILTQQQNPFPFYPSSNCTNAGASLEYTTEQYEAIRFFDNDYHINSAADPARPTNIYSANVTVDDISGMTLHWEGHEETTPVANLHLGVNLSLWNFGTNQWQQVQFTIGDNVDRLSNFTLDLAVHNSTGSDGTTEVRWQLITNRTDQGGGSPSIYDLNGNFYCETNHLSFMKSLQTWDSTCIMPADGSLIIQEDFPQEISYVNGLRLYKLKPIPTDKFDIVFEGKMKSDKLENILNGIFYYVDYENTDLMFTILDTYYKGGFKEVFFQRLRSELGLSYDDQLYDIKGNPAPGKQFYQTYRLPYNGSMEMIFNEDLLDIKNIRLEPHVDYQRELIQTDFVPFEITNPEKKVINFNYTGLVQVEILAWYKPNAHLRENDFFNSTDFIIESWRDPEFITKLVNKTNHNSLSIDTTFLNASFTHGAADNTDPIVANLVPLNNTVFFPNENITFVYNFTDFHGIVTDCAVHLNGKENTSTKTSGKDSFDFDEYFPNSISINMTDEGAYNYSVICKDDSNNMGSSVNYTFNISRSILAVTINDTNIQVSNATDNTTISTEGNVISLNNNVGIVTYTLRYNKSSSTEADTIINDSFPFRVLNSTGFPLYQLFQQNNSAELREDDIAFNGTRVGTIDESAQAISIWKIGGDKNNFEWMTLELESTINLASPVNYRCTGSLGTACKGLGWDEALNVWFFNNGTAIIWLNEQGELQDCRIRTGTNIVQFSSYATYYDGFAYIDDNAAGLRKIDSTAVVDNDACVFEDSIDDLCAKSAGRSFCSAMVNINGKFYGGTLSTFNNQLDTKIYDDSFVELSNLGNYSTTPDIVTDGFEFDGTHLISIHSTTGLQVRSLWNPSVCTFNLNLTESCSVNWTMISTVNTSQHFVDVLVESPFAASRMEATSNNTADNLINHTIITTTTVPVDSCSCPVASENWEIDCADACVITDSCDMQGNSVLITGAGTVNIQADITNWDRIYKSAGAGNVCRITEHLGGGFK